MLAERKTWGYTVKDVPAQDFIRAYAQFLKKNDRVRMPTWIDHVKTGKGKELAPEDPDWLYTRIAAIARKIYLRAHLGVGTLKHIYGQRQRNGHARNHHSAGAGKIIRFALQTLEGLGIVSRDKKCTEKKFSRIVSSNGRKELDVIANTIAKESYRQN